MRLLAPLVITLLLGSSARAAALADVVIVLDTSGGMDDEIAAVQAALPSFAATITGSGVDLHIVLVAQSGPICVPAPLGSGACPADTNLPGYRHTEVTVSSTDALSKLLSTYSTWSASLRAGSKRTIIVVTDDNSSLSAASFQVQLSALDPGFAGYHFDPIVGATTCPTNVANVGTVYLSLAAQTSGIVTNLCNPAAIGPGIQTIAAAVVAEQGIGIPALSRWGLASLAALLAAALTLSAKRGRRVS